MLRQPHHEYTFDVAYQSIAAQCFKEFGLMYRVWLGRQSKVCYCQPKLLSNQVQLTLIRTAKLPLLRETTAVDLHPQQQTFAIHLATCAKQSPSPSCVNEEKPTLERKHCP